MAVFNLTQLELMAIVAIFTFAATYNWLSKKSKPLETEPPAKLTKDGLSGRNTSAVPESSAKRAKDYLTCRIRGVPLDWDKDDLGQLLGTTVVVKSFATEIDGRSRTATATFPRDYPRQIPIMSSSGECLTVDQDFLGITTLYAPDNPKIDVIAVSGLGGHAFGSFKERNGDHMWLRDALPNDLFDQQTKRPMARIMIYGHDSHLAESHNMQELEDISISFRDSILQLAATPRPIVLIGHSLGGLIIKQALVSLLVSTPDCQLEYERLAKAVYGVVFLGVPHDGMDVDALRRVVRDKLSRSLIESLSSKNSSVLTNLRRDFNKVLDVHTDAETFCFYETKGSQTLQEDDSGKLNMDGPQTVLVTKSSATHCRASEHDSQHVCAIARSHSEIVKFGRHDHEYNKVRDRLQLLAQRAVDVKSLQLNDFTVPMNTLTKECLKSLAFPEMDNRSSDIDTEADGTCRWLLDHDAYSKWTSTDRGLLWIKGKPGSGKSTLLRYALKNVERTPDFDNGAVLASFFFHGRGTELQRTPLGLFRSVLHQVLSKVPNALPDLVTTFKKRQETRSEWQWHYKQLQDFLRLSLPNVLENRSMWLFIDALDESGDHALGLIRSFQSLLNSTPRNGFQFRICFTCRHYPILSGDCEFEICAEKENAQDISTYVQAQLSTDTTSEIPDSIPRSITEGASGVFMWARLVVERVRHRDYDGWGWKKIEEDIKTIPQDLDKLYQQLIYGMREKSASLKLIQWISFATRPLRLAEVRWAMFVDLTCPHRSLQQCEQCRHCQQCPEAEDYGSGKMKRRIQSLTCGLAEIVGSADYGVVQFIHQSVKDFFLNKGLSALDDSSKIGESPAVESFVRIAHGRLYQSCILYMGMEEICQSTARDEVDLFSNFPLLRYATLSWMAHLRESQVSQVTATSQDSLLDYLPLPSYNFLQSWVQMYGTLRRRDRDCPPKGTTQVHVASRYRLTNWLRVYLQDSDQTGKAIDTTDEAGRTPLSWATEEGHETVVKLLLDTGNVDVDSRDKLGRTPLSRAAEKGHETVVKLLLDTGNVDVDSRDNLGRTPLSRAAEKGYEAVARLLIDFGKADADSRDYSNRAPLSWAAGNGHEAVVKLVINIDNVDVDLTDDSGWTPLSRAARDGHEAVVKLFVGQQREVCLTERAICDITRQCDKQVIKGLLGLRRNLSLGGVTTVTEAVVIAAAQNRDNGKEVMTLLLNQRGDEIHITEDIVIAAAQNWENGKEIMTLLLNQRGDEIHITEDIVKAAAGNKISGKEIITLLLNQRGDEVIITEDILKKAAGNWGDQEIIALLLNQRGDEVIITEDIIEAAAGNRASGKEIMKLLLDQRGDEIRIREDIVKVAAGNEESGKEIITLLLDQRGDEVIITEDIVEAAAGNEESGKEIMKLLLDQRGDEVIITEDILKTAAGNLGNQEIIALLLDQRGKEIAITEGVLKKAAGNTRKGEEIMKLLFDQRGEEIAITEGVLKKAAGNTRKGEEIMKLLFDQRGEEIAITEEVIKAAGGTGDTYNGEPVMKLILSRRGDKIPITEEVVSTVAGRFSSKMIRQLFSQRGDEIIVTENIVEAAARNLIDGKRVMMLLLDQWGNDIAITEKVVKAAAGNPIHGIRIMKLLFSLRGSEIVITEDILDAAAKNWRDSEGMMALLLEKRGDIT